MTFTADIRAMLPATSVEISLETGISVHRVNALLQYMAHAKLAKHTAIRRTDRRVISQKNKTGPAPYIWELTA